MIKHIVVSDKPLDFLPADTDTLFLSATDFISNKASIDLRKASGIKVVNLCSNFDYLSKGYYCSLLAEARGMRCVPSVANVVTLNWKRHYQSNLPELNTLLERYFKEPADEPTSRTYTVYFGRTSEDSLEELCRRLFDLFRFPLMSVEIKLDAKGKWVVGEVKPLSITDLPRQKHEAFINALNRFTGTAWRTKEGKKEKHWLAILYDPDDKQPPSNKTALQKFIKAGKELGIAVELITKSDFATLLEYDALFIRETTAINHHTYRFALKAESEGLACIDDTQSIIRCCNKVFQYEILESKHVPLPRTYIIDRKSEKQFEEDLSYPAVVKIPDGAFSKGVIKVTDPATFREAVTELLKKSEIVLVQEFVSSEFDWRIGILDNKPLYACKYYMAEGHWQIYNHSAKTIKRKEGRHETMPVEDVPDVVMDVALKAAKYMGDGLYGVDLKQSGDKVVVIEVNDNPSIDSGVEDMVLGDALYKTIMESFIRRIEA